MEENAIHPATPAAVPPEAPLEGATLTCRNCRQASPAGLHRCPFCGFGLRTGTAAALAALAAAAGVATAAYYGYVLGTTEASIIRPAFFALTGLAGLLGAWSVFQGRRAGWLGLHVVWAAQILVPFVFALLTRRDVVRSLTLDAMSLLLVKLPILFGLVLAWVPSTRAYCAAASNLMTLFRRELSSFMYYPLAYVIMTAYLLIAGLFFSGFLYNVSLRGGGGFNMEEGLEQVFGAVMTFLIFCSPILTMRLVAEERRTGTIEVLMTAPVTDLQIILGKYLSTMAFFVILLVPSLLYMFLMSQYLGPSVTPDYGLLVGGYVGCLFLASGFFAIGLFVSTLTRNQIVAAIITFVVIVAMFVLPRIAEGVQTDWIRKLVEYVNFIQYHFTFTRGMIDSRAVVFDVSLTVFFLFLSVRMLESRRWA
jgi:ABC-2 type transport system permease protein